MARPYWRAGAFILLSVAAAQAQSAPPSPGAPPGPEEADAPHPPGMEHGRMGMHRGMMPVMPLRGAAFHFSKDGAEIDIRCAASEPTRACVDAASILIDKVAATVAAH